MNHRTSFVLLSLLVTSASLSATAQQSASQPPVKGMASTVGLFTYPEKKQSAQQQLTDESQCYNNAKSQTGFDPNATSTAPNTQSAGSGNDHGAAKGAAKGAVIAGATGGDAGQGAARGAVIGGIRSKRKQKKAEEKAEKQDEANKEQLQKQQDDFKRAMSACLGARGYSVK
jgi:uncharacterized protein involved in copper resistance